MPKNEYEQNEFVMDQNTQKLIEEAQAAFNTLKNIASKLQAVGNVAQFTGNEEDDEYIEDIATLRIEDEDDDAFDAFDDEEDDTDLSYYGRDIDAGHFGHSEQFGFGGGRGCGCGCGCRCKYKYVPKPQVYPCVCRRCDLLRAKAYTNLVLGLSDLKDAFDLLPIVKGKFEDAVESLRDAKKLFKKARICSIRFGCNFYCRTRGKRRCKFPR